MGKSLVEARANITDGSENPLLSAALQGYHQLAHFLIDLGCPVDVQTTIVLALKICASAFHIMKLAGRLPANEFALFLITAYPTCNVWTALHVAVFFGHESMIQELLALRADPHIGGRLARDFAIARGHGNNILDLLQ